MKKAALNCWALKVVITKISTGKITVLKTQLPSREEARRLKKVTINHYRRFKDAVDVVATIHKAVHSQTENYDTLVINEKIYY